MKTLLISFMLLTSNNQITLQKSYINGNNITHQKIICARCPFPSGLNDSRTRKVAIEKIKNNDIKLAEQEKKDVLYYISLKYQ